MIAYEEIQKINDRINDIQRRLGNVRRAVGEGVQGPAISTDNAVARFDGTTGKKIQNSLVYVDDSGNLSVEGNLYLVNNFYCQKAIYTTLSINTQDNITVFGEVTVNQNQGSGEEGVKFRSISNTFSRIAQSDAEGIASSSDLRIGLDESLRNIIICDIGDIGNDFGTSAEVHPSLWLFEAATPYYYCKINATEWSTSKNPFYFKPKERLVFRHQDDISATEAFMFDSEGPAALIGSSGDQPFLYLEPRVKQTGTAKFYGILMDVTEDSVVGTADRLMALWVDTDMRFDVGYEGELFLYESGSSGARYSEILQSKAEGISGKSDLRIGLDNDMTNLIILKREDIAADLGLSAVSEPSFYVYDSVPQNYIRFRANNIKFSKNDSYVDAQMRLQFYAQTDNVSTATPTFLFTGVSGVQLTASSGEQAFFKITPDIYQSGTASYVSLLVNTTETATGSGTKKLMSLQLAGEPRFDIIRHGAARLYESLSAGARYAELNQSNAEGITDSSDFRIGLDESLRNLVLCDKSDSGIDFGMTAQSDPTFWFRSADAATGKYSRLSWQSLYNYGAAFQIRAGSSYLLLESAASIYLRARSDMASGNFLVIDSSSGIELTSSSAEQAWISVKPKINQSGTASYVGFLMDVTETAAVGTNDFLMALRLAGAQKFRIKPSGVIEAYGNINVMHAAGGLQFQGTHGGGNEHITYEDSGGTARYALLFPGSNQVHLLNRASNGTVEIHANTATAGAGGDVKVAEFEDDIIKLFESAGIVFIGDNSNAKMTWGLTLNQGDNDDAIFAVKSSDVAHGCSDYQETDTYGAISKALAASGGIMIDGFTEGSFAIHNRGFITSCNTAKSTAANAAFLMSALKISGASIGDVDADANVACFRARRGGSTEAVAIIDEDGELHLDATVQENAWDDFDDLVLASDYSRILAARWNELKKYSIRDLHNADLLTYTPAAESGSGKDEVFIKVKRGLIFALCAFKQVHDKFQKQEKRIRKLEKIINQLNA